MVPSLFFLRRIGVVTNMLMVISLIVASQRLAGVLVNLSSFKSDVSPKMSHRSEAEFELPR